MTLHVHRIDHTSLSMDKITPRPSRDASTDKGVSTNCPSTLYRWSLPISTVICAFLLILIVTTRELPPMGLVMNDSRLVFTAFMDIFLDALPFMILGVLLSTVVENFIPEGSSDE